MTATLYISVDTSSRSLGSLAVAQALEETFPQLTVVRTGSRGCFWLEPMVEIAVDSQRHAFGPISADADLSSILFNGAPNTEHSAYLGLTNELDFFYLQNRINFNRCGLYDPLDFQSWQELGGAVGLQKAIACSSQEIIDQVKLSGLRGRGGAGFPTGIKWQTVLDCAGEQKYIVCNADEGDSGTFADRMLIEGDPLTLIEGMAIAGLATNATRGYIYLRSEYPLAARIMKKALQIAEDHNVIGKNILGSGKDFYLELRIGAGAYICGEETSLLESLEGKRGTIRYKPPLPAIEGLFGKPTVVNNVITLASIGAIIADGGGSYQKHGTGRSRGTLTVQLSGNIARGGLYEVDFGCNLRELIKRAGGTATGNPIKAVQAGGPLGAYIPADKLDIELDYEAFASQGFMIGHGGFVVFDDSVDMAEQAQFSMKFCADESCGKCTPCRIGSVRGAELIASIRVENKDRDKRIGALRDLCDTMANTSLCAMGGLAPMPVLSALDNFPEDFSAN